MDTDFEDDGDGESFCEGDPTEFNLVELERLQHQIDTINAEENELEQIALAKEWVNQLNGTPTI